jgi:hypothetical protein
LLTQPRLIVAELGPRGQHVQKNRRNAGMPTCGWNGGFG